MKLSTITGMLRSGYWSWGTYASMVTKFRTGTVRVHKAAVVAPAGDTFVLRVSFGHPFVAAVLTADDKWRLNVAASQLDHRTLQNIIHAATGMHIWSDRSLHRNKRNPVRAAGLLGQQSVYRYSVPADYGLTVQRGHVLHDTAEPDRVLRVNRTKSAPLLANIREFTKFTKVTMALDGALAALMATDPAEYKSEAELTKLMADSENGLDPEWFYHYAVAYFHHSRHQWRFIQTTAAHTAALRDSTIRRYKDSLYNLKGVYEYQEEPQPNPAQSIA